MLRAALSSLPVSLVPCRFCGLSVPWPSFRFPNCASRCLLIPAPGNAAFAPLSQPVPPRPRAAGERHHPRAHRYLHTSVSPKRKGPQLCLATQPRNLVLLLDSLSTRLFRQMAQSLVSPVLCARGTTDGPGPCLASVVLQGETNLAKCAPPLMPLAQGPRLTAL